MLEDYGKAKPLLSGGRGRRFKSSHSDQYSISHAGKRSVSRPELTERGVKFRHRAHRYS
jgi:hypothetical protein